MNKSLLNAETPHILQDPGVSEVLYDLIFSKGKREASI